MDHTRIWPPSLSVPDEPTKSLDEDLLPSDQARIIGGGAVAERVERWLGLLQAGPKEPLFDEVVAPKQRAASTRERPTGPWLSLERAADFLGEPSPEALRKKLDRNSIRSNDGSVEANFDGLTARKFRRLWKVRLSSRWTETGGDR